jgi:molybdate transport system substrate-binding protein
MSTRFVVVALLMVRIGLVFLFPPDVAAQTTNVHVLSSVGLKGVIDEMLPKWERVIGRRIEVQFSAAAAIKQRIDAGEEFDVAILPTGLIDALVKEGKISDGTRVEIARAGIGIGVRSGAPKPDIGTPEKLKQVLISAKSITYPANGASRSSIENMFEHLGIANEIRLKTIFPNEEGGPQASVAAGNADLVITLVSEIVSSRGIELIGPLPAELQSYIVFSAGVGTNVSNAEAAKALIKLISDPLMAPAFQAKGLVFGAGSVGK